MTLVLLVIVGSLICLDRTQWLQVMVSRPIVLAPIMGWFAGMPLLGASIGLAFEFLYAGRLPVGSHVPPSDTLAAWGATGLLVLSPDMQTFAGAGFCAALALPMAEVGRGVDIWIRKMNGRLAARVEQALRRGDLKLLEVTPWRSLLLGMALYGLVLLAFFMLGMALASLLWPMVPPWLATAFALFLAGLPILGLAESSSSLDPNRFPRSAVVGLAAGIALLMWVM